MNETILFSPVGGTDPIALVNHRDGSMLHIARWYSATKVILYMSSEVLENHRIDNRYIYSLECLGKLQNRQISCETIERPDLKNVQEYDFFYQEFRKIIVNIFQKMDPSDQLILNVSSGTPAMKSALMVLYTLGEFPCKAIQVITPAKKMNEHIHNNYDIKMLWECNEDNNTGSENRCHEVKCPALSIFQREEIIKRHISVYDYRAAVTVARGIPETDRKRYFDLLQMAESRMLLDFPKVDSVLETSGIDCIPVREEEDRKCFEYALLLEIKLNRGEYTDFVRAITPLTVDLFETILKRRFRINIKRYCFYDNKTSSWKWSSEKLKGTKILEALDSGYSGQFKGTDVYSDHLRILIKHFSRDTRLKKTVDEMRHIEKNIRNLAAHEIVSITEYKIKKLTGFSSTQILEKIKQLFDYAEIKPQDSDKLKDSDWKSYDNMNQIILNAMGTIESEREWI